MTDINHIVVYDTDHYEVVRCSEPREMCKDVQGVDQAVNFKLINKRHQTVEGKFVQYPIAIDTCNYFTRLTDMVHSGTPEAITELMNASIN